MFTNTIGGRRATSTRAMGGLNTTAAAERHGRRATSVERHVLAHNAIVLDGGMGHQLKAMGVEIEGPVGSQSRFLGVCMANVDKPDIVVDAHKAYLNAGADVITTNSYAAVPKTVELAGDKTVEDVKNVIRAAGECARKALKDTGSSARVAGSLPPLTPSYRPDLVQDQDVLDKDYRMIAETIAPYSDILLCETMSLAREAKAAAEAASTANKPVWVAWTLSEKADGTLRSGETVEDAWRQVSHLPLVDALLFNCSSVLAVEVAVKHLRHLVPAHIRLGGYANGFLTAESGNGAYDEELTPEKYTAHVREWVSNGASVLGGCCGIFPRHIDHLRQWVDGTIDVGSVSIQPAPQAHLDNIVLIKDGPFQPSSDTTIACNC